MKQDWQNKRVVVIGAGKSGLALVRFLVERGAQVALSERRSRDQIAALDAIADLPVRFNLGGHDLSLFEQADLVAVSPGVPLDSEPLRRAAAANVPLLGEVELAARELSVPLIGITGTNGKSTVTCLLGRILKGCGKSVFVGGNLGEPLIGACSGDYAAAVVELSSFQLETISTFHPAIGVLLNLSPDHLDRYPDSASYYAAKLRLFENMSAADYAVLNADDPEIVRLSAGIQAHKVWFSARGHLVEGLVRLEDTLVWNWQGADQRFSLETLSLPGEHNIENAMAAMIPALLWRCPAESAWQAVCSFTGLPHRMQLVRTLNGVTWYNDSKGTNVGSVRKSLAGFQPHQVTLIAGGKDKGGDYRLLRPLLEKKVKQVLLLGEAAERMAAELAGSCPISQLPDLATAVNQAAAQTREGDVVLLSPACSSFDMFANFEERGHVFEHLVRQLPEGEASP
jgi:UDP-N-acetylmuramoylalanine--D-glutamate ligase